MGPKNYVENSIFCVSRHLDAVSDVISQFEVFTKCGCTKLGIPVPSLLFCLAYFT